MEAETPYERTKRLVRERADRIAARLQAENLERRKRRLVGRRRCGRGDL